MLEDDIKEFLEAAILAPSADNTQPWRVSIESSIVSLYYVPERDISRYDSGARASLMSLGAFIENFCIAAAMKGYVVDVKTELPVEKNSWRTAVMTCVQKKQALSDDEENTLLFKQIPKRATNRKPYRKEVLSSEIKKRLLSSVTPLDWGRVVILDSPQTELTKAAGAAGKIMFQNEHVHEGLFEHIRWNKEEVERTKDGFSIKTFELPLPGKLIFALARSKKRLAFLNRTLNFASTMPAGMAQSFGKSAAFIAILSKGREYSDYILTGRAMERLWLTATEANVQLHPIGALLFFKDAIDAHTTNAYNSDDVATVEQSYPAIAKAFGAQEGEHVLFLFRAGFGKPPSDHTLRLPLERILKKL